LQFKGLLRFELGGSVLGAIIAPLLARRRNADVVADGGEPGSWKNYFTSVPEAVPLEGVFAFSYEDVEGSRTDRTVEALMLIPRPDSVTLFGRCRSRNEYRHFNLARVANMVDAESGEIVANPSHDLLRRSRDHG
jgi:predicted DNA-binding transcriptional regulator YafY